MKGYLFVSKKIPVKPFVTFITKTMLTFSALLHFAHLQDSSRSKTKKKKYCALWYVSL